MGRNLKSNCLRIGEMRNKAKIQMFFYYYLVKMINCKMLQENR